jgi:type IV pilus assembly protein PilM
MKPDNIDLDFLRADDSTPPGPHFKNGSAKAKLRLDEFSEKADIADMVDLSLLLADKISRFGIEQTVKPKSAPERGDESRPPSQPQPGVDFEINEDALKLPLDLEAETARSENLPPLENNREIVFNFGDNPSQELVFSLDEPETEITSPVNLETEENLEFRSLPPELEAPLILPTEPEPRVPPTLSSEMLETESAKADIQTASDHKLEFDLRIEEPAIEPSVEETLETPDEPLHIYAKPAESKESKFQRPAAVKFESRPRAAQPQPKPATPASVLSANFSLGSLFENTRLLGLDIGASSMKYIVLKKGARGLKLVDCGTRPLPALPVEVSEEDKRKLIGHSLRRHFQIKSLKNTLITSAISGLEVFFQNIQVPKMARKELVRAVPWTCRKDFPFPMETTVFEYQVLNSKQKKDGSKFDIFVVAAQESVIGNHMEVLKHAQIVPGKISTLPVALFHLFKETVKSDHSKNYAVLDIGGKSSHFVFIKGGQLLFAREIATGGDDLTDALSGSIFVEGDEINVTKKQAEQLKRRYGVIDVDEEMRTAEGVPVKEILVMMGPVIEKLTSEIRRTVDFVKEKLGVASLEKIYLTGGGAFLKNLPAKLMHELNTEVQILNPFDTISMSAGAKREELLRMGPRFATAVGLALDRKMALNLLPQKLKGAHTFQNFKRMFRYVFVILILMMVWLSQDVKFELRDIKGEFERINQEFNQVRPKRDKFLELQKTLNQIRARTELYNSQIEIRLDTAEHLKALSNLLPANITLTSLQLQYRDAQNEQKEAYVQEMLILEGVAFQSNSMEGINLAKFLMALERSNYFYAVDLRYQKIRDDGNLAFTLECEL